MEQADKKDVSIENIQVHLRISTKSAILLVGIVDISLTDKVYSVLFTYVIHMQTTMAMK